MVCLKAEDRAERRGRRDERDKNENGKYEGIGGAVLRCRCRRSTPCRKNWAGVPKLKGLYVDGKQKLTLSFFFFFKKDRRKRKRYVNPLRNV